MPGRQHPLPSCLCRGGARVNHEGGEKRERSSQRAAGRWASAITLRAFCSRPVRTHGVNGSHLSKG